jgi:hypothetical protein
MKGAEAFQIYAESCPNLVQLGVQRRPGNALNLEIGAPMPRCKLRPPPSWGPKAPSVARWLMSGGDPLVLGLCSRGACPLKPDHCDDCGHRGEHHDQGCTVENCSCANKRLTGT